MESGNETYEYTYINNARGRFQTFTNVIVFFQKNGSSNFGVFRNGTFSFSLSSLTFSSRPVRGQR